MKSRTCDTAKRDFHQKKKSVEPLRSRQFYYNFLHDIDFDVIPT